MYNITEYNTIRWGDSAGVFEEALPKNFLARNGWEGPQVVLTWDALAEQAISQVRLLRKIGSYSIDPEDGKKLIAKVGGPYPKFFTDDEVESGVVYYYTLLVKELISGSFLLDSSVMKSVMPVFTGHFTKSMFTLMPPPHRLADQGMA